MDEHTEKDVEQTSEESASDHVATEDSFKTRIVESTASDVQSGSVVVQTSIVRSSDHLASGDSRIVDSAASDSQFCSAGMDMSEVAASDQVAIGDYEKTQIVDSAAIDIRAGSALLGLFEETASDCLGCGDFYEKTRFADCSVSDIQDGSAVVEISKETVNDHVVRGESDMTPTVSDVQAGNSLVQSSEEVAADHVAGGDCEKTQLVDSTISDIQIGSSVVKTWKETAINHVACTDSERARIIEYIASDIQDLVKDATKGPSTERVDAGEGGSCYGADVSVGVLPSDIRVDGVSTRDSGDDGAGKLSKNGNRNPRESKRVGLERATKGLVVESDEAGGSGFKINTESDVDALKLRSEGVDEESGGIVESKEEILADVYTAITEAADVGVRDVRNMAIDGVVEVSTGEKIQVVPENNMAAAAGKKELEGKSRNEYAEGGGFNVIMDLNFSETRLPMNELHDERVENGVIQDSTIAKSKLADKNITSLDGLDSDAFNENFCFSVEELQATVEKANGSTENRHNAFADSQSSQDPSQVVVAGDDVATEKMSCKSCQVNSIVESEKGANDQEADNEKAGLQKETGEVETACAAIGNNTDLNSTSSHPVVNAEVAEIDDMIPSDPNSKVLVHVTRKDQELKLEESFDKMVEQECGGDSLTMVEGRISVLNSNSELELPKEWDYNLKFEGLNEKKTVIDENVADEMEGAEQATVSEITVKANEVTYQLSPDEEGEFEVFDLVWGKVRSHPWWPGQIFDPSDASEKAMKYQKKYCFLVAYFGDRTFAWNDASLLKPFVSHFSQVEKQSNSESFHNAVNCALEEVSRRVEFGLACSCIPAEIYNKIKHQMVENAGIRKESSIQNGMDKSLSADTFEPGKLVEYMKALAQSPAGGADRLQIVVVKSQLLAIYRMRGYSDLPEFHFCGDLLENDDTLQIGNELMADNSAFYGDNATSDQQNVQTQRSNYRKRKYDLKDSQNPKKKERSGTLGESWDSGDDEIGSDGKTNTKLLSYSSGKKRRGVDSLADETEGRKTISLAKGTPVSVPKSSFKIGECIRRVASQMTASPSILKSNTEKMYANSDGLVADGSDSLVQHLEDAAIESLTVPTEYSSLSELLLQLHLSAQDPLERYALSTVIVSFFSDFRNASIVEKREKVLGKKRQQSTGDYPETFEFEDMNDTYWTDRVIQNGSEEQPVRKSRKRDNQLASGDPDKLLNKSNSRKRNSDSNQTLLAEKPDGYVDENAAAELVMHFPVVDSVPSESRLIKMFKRFGPLKEIETEIDRDTNRARVVFKKCSDAESAYSSATKFNIFGSMLVNYQLNYTITVPFKTEPLVALQGEEDATVFLQF